MGEITAAVEYSFTAENAKQDTAFFVRQKLFKVEIFLVIPALAALIFFILTQNNYCLFLLFCSFACMLSLIVSSVFAKKNSVKRFHTLYNNKVPTVRVIFSDAVNTCTDCGDSNHTYKRVEYNALKGIKKSKTSLYLIFDGNLILALPYNAFTTGTPEQLCEYLKDKMRTK